MSELIDIVTPENWHLHTMEDYVADVQATIAALRSELSDAHKRLEDALNEIAHLKDTRQDPYDQIEVMRSELSQLREQMRWRKYPDEKPTPGKQYLVISDNGTKLTASFTFLRGEPEWLESFDDVRLYGITMFQEIQQPLPQPPEEA